MFGITYGIPNSLQISTNSQNEMEFTGSPYSCKCSNRNMIDYPRINPPCYRDSIKNGSRKESTLSPRNLFSSEGGHITSGLENFPQYVKGSFPTELSGESSFYELPESLYVPELPENNLDYDQRTPVADHIFVNNQESISSGLIAELPYVDGDQPGSRIPRHIEFEESLSSAGHCQSDTLGFDSSAEVEIIDTNAEIPNQMNTSHLLPASLISMPLQSLTSRKSMCPAIETNVNSFRGNVNDTQYQGRLFGDSPRISSPDTASTDASGETFPSDSGYASRARQSNCTSATSPRSVFPGDERLGFENKLFGEFGHEGYSNQSCGLQPDQSNSLNWPGPASSQSEHNGLYRDPHIQASHLSNFKENPLELRGTEVVDNSITAYTAQSGTDIDRTFQSHLYAGGASQYLKLPTQYDDYWRNIIPRADKHVMTGAATLTLATGTENQCAPSPFEIYQAGRVSPWSPEDFHLCGGYDQNFNFATIPEAQLPKEKEEEEEDDAKIFTYDNSSPKSDSKVIKCSYPGCDHEPGGKDQWKLGNLRRHEKEKHKMNLKNRIVCTRTDCKITFTRVGNRDTHLETIHGAVIPRQKRNRRNSMVENTKKPSDSSRIAKAPQKIGGLTNRPKQNRSQSVPGPLNNTEF
ncbi:hypothetical protein BOTCAL_0107g00240 [Botryotinia calthae]|uniref:C2H2-type domain-containing protein n=1 Tax=Botryotinia calthae TaxID=38488 RepID=A0A4Y8D813_9HELO|nr:hypothetical protein BOTCAL_0107g00240 [Botryotinia calthae]